MRRFLPLLVMLAANAVAANVDAGKSVLQKYNCASCHGADYNSPVDPAYPKLAGQHADYLRHALQAYQRGGVGLSGRGNAIMSSMAKPLSPADIDNIAAYLSSLKGSLVQQK